MLQTLVNRLHRPAAAPVAAPLAPPLAAPAAVPPSVGAPAPASARGSGDSGRASRLWRAGRQRQTQWSHLVPRFIASAVIR